MKYAKHVTQVAVLLSFFSLFLFLISPAIPKTLLDYTFLIVGIIFSSFLFVAVLKLLKSI